MQLSADSLSHAPGQAGLHSHLASRAHVKAVEAPCHAPACRQGYSTALLRLGFDPFQICPWMASFPHGCLSYPPCWA